MFKHVLTALLLTFVTLQSAVGQTQVKPFIADVAAVESFQRTQHEKLLTFKDAQGQVLKRVLNAETVTDIATQLMASKASGDQREVEELFTRIGALMEPYAAAFKKSPSTYEHEYVEVIGVQIALLSAMDGMIGGQLKQLRETSSKQSAVTPATLHQIQTAMGQAAMAAQKLFRELRTTLVADAMALSATDALGTNSKKRLADIVQKYG